MSLCTAIALQMCIRINNYRIKQVRTANVCIYPLQKLCIHLACLLSNPILYSRTSGSLFLLFLSYFFLNSTLASKIINMLVKSIFYIHLYIKLSSFSCHSCQITICRNNKYVWTCFNLLCLFFIFYGIQVIYNVFFSVFDIFMIGIIVKPLHNFVPGCFVFVKVRLYTCILFISIN